MPYDPAVVDTVVQHKHYRIEGQEFAALLCVESGVWDYLLNKTNGCSSKRRLIAGEVMAFLCIVALIWLDEVIDIPHLLLGADPTPMNWREALSESVITAIVAMVIIGYTKRLLQKVNILEGLLPICASCKRIRDCQGDWHQMEAYIRDRSEAEFTHSVCPDCRDKLYAELKRDR